MKNLPCLTHVTVAHTFAYWGWREDNRPIGYEKHFLQSPLGRKWLRECLILQASSNPLYCAQIVTLINNVLSVIALSGAKVRSFNTSEKGNRIEDVDVFDSLFQSEQPNMFNVFSNLVEISLHSKSSTESQIRASSLKCVLQSAHILQYLGLHMGRITSGNPLVDNFYALLGSDVTLPQLKRLDLMYMHTRVSTIISMLKRYRTLECFAAAAIKVHRSPFESWNQVDGIMSKKFFPRLRKYSTCTTTMPA